MVYWESKLRRYMKTKKTEKKSFEMAFKELEEISKNFETNNLSLDEMVSSFKKGSELSKYCMDKLNNAKLEIEKITKK